MRNLLNFVIKYSTWFVFAFYVLLSCVLLAGSRSYQQSVFLTSANTVSSAVYGVSNNVTGYFNLRQINESLQQSNARLADEVLNLQTQLAACRAVLSDSVGVADIRRFGYVTAVVLNNSVRHPRNYFTIDKGLADGVRSGMGVVDQNGIVGIVNVSGRRSSRVISLLNETQHFSVKIKGTPFVGSLTWHGGDPSIAYVEEIPRHVRLSVGDSIVTSGYSTTFPEGLPVGTVLSRIRGNDDNFFTVKVRMFSDFRTLSTVRVIRDIYKEELDSLAKFDFKPE